MSDSDDEVIEDEYNVEREEDEEDKGIREYYEQKERDCNPIENKDLIIKEIKYQIHVYYEASKQPHIHGIITKLDVQLKMKDGGNIEMTCGWDDYISVPNHDGLTSEERQIIERVLNEKIAIEELSQHLHGLPVLFGGTVECD